MIAAAGLIALLQTSSGQTTGRETTLRAEVTTNKERYCEGGPDTAVLQLDCDIRFINAGGEPLIVQKEGDVVQVSLAEKVEDLAHPKYQYLPTYYSAGGSSVDTPRPGAAFAILAISRSLEFRRTVSVLVKIAEPQPGFIVPGSYWLQLRIGTWTDSDELAARLRERWKRWGRLWTDDVKSTPVFVRIEWPANLQRCN